MPLSYNIAPPPLPPLLGEVLPLHHPTSTLPPRGMMLIIWPIPPIGGSGGSGGGGGGGGGGGSGS